MNQLSKIGVCVFVVTSGSFATIRNVPDDYVSIQTAVDASIAGDTVLVGMGIYEESISIPSRDLTIASDYIFSNDSTDIEQCVIRPAPQSAARAINLSANDAQTGFSLIGVTIKGSGSGSEISGGGLSAFNRRLDIQYCNFDSCYSFFGGAIFAELCSLRVSNSKILRTGAFEQGMACHLTDCNSEIDSSEIGFCFSTRTDASENSLWVERGIFTIRGSLLHDTGWSITPGSVGIRQYDIVSRIRIVGCTISNNRFHQFVRLPGEGHLIWSNIEFDSNLVSENEFQHDLFSYFDADTGSVTAFRYNVFQRNRRISEGNFISRMFFTANGRTQHTNISHNVFIENESQENSVALIGGSTDSSFVKFHNNYMFDNSCAGFANPPGGIIMIIGVGDGVVYHNVFAQSHGYAAYHGINSEPFSVAQYCYWGDSTGPRQIDENPLGSGDSVGTRISVSPWSVDSLFTPSSAEESRPTTFALGFPFPNPFNSTVTIEYALAREQDVTLEIYDVLGRQVETLLSERQSVGVHSVKWNADNFASGLYFAKLSTPTSASQAVKLLLMK